MSFECKDSLLHVANCMLLREKATPRPRKTISLRHLSLSESSGHLEDDQWISTPLLQIRVYDHITPVCLQSS